MDPLTGPHQIHLSCSVPALLPHLSPKDLSAFTQPQTSASLFFSPSQSPQEKKWNECNSFPILGSWTFPPASLPQTLLYFFSSRENKTHRMHILRFDNFLLSRTKAGPSLYCPALGKGSGISGILFLSPGRFLDWECGNLAPQWDRNGHKSQGNEEKHHLGWWESTMNPQNLPELLPEVIPVHHLYGVGT